MIGLGNPSLQPIINIMPIRLAHTDVKCSGRNVVWTGFTICALEQE